MGRFQLLGFSELTFPATYNWLKSVLIGLVGLFIFVFVLIIGVIAVLQTYPASLEVVLEYAASKVLDRELQIGELIEAELNGDVYLLARDVRLANPDWADPPDFVRVERLLVRINLTSIWREGPILIDRLELTDASVTLLDPSEHTPNWDFWPGDIDEATQQSDTEVEAGLKPVFPVLFSDWHISNSEIVYRDPDQDIVISIQELAIQEPYEGALINLDLAGIVNDIPLEAKGHIGPATALLTQRDLNLDLVVSVGEFTLEARGYIENLATLSGSDLHLKIAAPRSRPILDILGMPEIRDGPLSFEGHVTDAHPGVAVDAVGALDEFDFHFSGKLADPLALDGVDVTLTLDGPSLTEAGAIFNLAGLPELPFEVSAEIYRDGRVLDLRNGLIKAGLGRLTIQGRLPDFPGIDDWELKLEGKGFNLSLFGPLIGVEGLAAVPYSFKGNLGSTDEGVERVDIRIESPDSSLSLNGVIGNPPGYLGSRLELMLSGSSLASVGPWLRVHDLPNLAFDASGELSLSASGWQLRNAAVNTTGLQLGLEVELDQLPEPTHLDAKLKLSSQDLAATLSAFGFELQGLPAFPVSLSGKLAGSPDKLKISQATIDSDESRLSVSGMLGDAFTLTGLDLAVGFTTPDMLKFLPATDDDPLANLPLDASGQVTMSPQGIELNDFQGHIGAAQMALNGLINTDASHDNSHFSLSTEGPDLGKVLGPWLEQDIANVPFELSMDASMQGGGVKVERLDATVADTELRARIDMDKLEDWSSAHGDIQITGSSSLNLARLLGVDMTMPDADFALKVGVQKSPDWLRLNPITLNWGKSDYSGSVNIHPGAVPTIQANLHSKFVSLPFLLPDVKEVQENQPATVDDSVHESVSVDQSTIQELTGRVISSEPLNFGWIKDLDATLKYKVDEMYLRADASVSANIDISIADGVLSSHELSWDGTLSIGDAELTIQALRDEARFDIYLDVERMPLVFLMGGEPEYQSDSFYRARVEARGNSLQELARSSNGTLVFKAGGGRMDNQGLDLILGDFLREISNKLNPFRQTESYTQVVCHAGAMTIKDGKAAMAPGFVLRTDKMDISSTGTIDLHNEQLDLAFNTRSRGGTGVSAGKAVTPYLKIGGTLADPGLALDAKGAAVSSGAAVATGGLSILAEGLWDRWVATSRNPCESLISEISKEGSESYKSLLTTSGKTAGPK
jgi:uncharacterized protein involved in outer membrane biogenesis